MISTPTTPAPEGAQPDYRHELAVAMQLARQAGAIVQTFYDVPPTIRWKDPTEPVTEADRAVNAYLVKQIGQLFPEDGVLAEESKDDFSRLTRERVWMVDPLDGTAEFIAHNGEFVIMIGLAVAGEPVVGVVYQPIDDVMYAAARGGGAYLEEFGERTPPAGVWRARPAAVPARREPISSPAHGRHDHAADGPAA